MKFVLSFIYWPMTPHKPPKHLDVGRLQAGTITNMWLRATGETS